MSRSFFQAPQQVQQGLPVGTVPSDFRPDAQEAVDIDADAGASAAAAAGAGAGADAGAAAGPDASPEVSEAGSTGSGERTASKRDQEDKELSGHKKQKGTKARVEQESGLNYIFKSNTGLFPVVQVLAGHLSPFNLARLSQVSRASRGALINNFFWIDKLDRLSNSSGCQLYKSADFPEGTLKVVYGVLIKSYKVLSYYQYGYGRFMRYWQFHVLEIAILSGNVDLFTSLNKESCVLVANSQIQWQRFLLCAVISHSTEMLKCILGKAPENIKQNILFAEDCFSMRAVRYLNNAENIQLISSYVSGGPDEAPTPAIGGISGADPKTYNSLSGRSGVSVDTSQAPSSLVGEVRYATLLSAIEKGDQTILNTPGFLPQGSDLQAILKSNAGVIAFEKAVDEGHVDVILWVWDQLPSSCSEILGYVSDRILEKENINSLKYLLDFLLQDAREKKLCFQEFNLSKLDSQKFARILNSLEYKYKKIFIDLSELDAFNDGASFEFAEAMITFWREQESDGYKPADEKLECAAGGARQAGVLSDGCLAHLKWLFDAAVRSRSSTEVIEILDLIFGFIQDAEQKKSFVREPSAINYGSICICPAIYYCDVSVLIQLLSVFSTDDEKEEVIAIAYPIYDNDEMCTPMTAAIYGGNVNVFDLLVQTIKDKDALIAALKFEDYSALIFKIRSLSNNRYVDIGEIDSFIYMFKKVFAILELPEEKTEFLKAENGAFLSCAVKAGYSQLLMLIIESLDEVEIKDEVVALCACDQSVESLLIEGAWCKNPEFIVTLLLAFPDMINEVFTGLLLKHQSLSSSEMGYISCCSTTPSILFYALAKKDFKVAIKLLSQLEDRYKELVLEDFSKPYRMELEKLSNAIIGMPSLGTGGATAAAAAAVAGSFGLG